MTRLDCFNYFVTIVESIKWLKGLEDITLNDLGLKAVFECEISKAGLKPEWFKGDKLIKRSEKYEFVSANGNHTLTIDDCRDEDVSKYTVKFEGDVKSTGKLIIKGRCNIYVECLLRSQFLGLNDPGISYKPFSQLT